MNKTRSPVQLPAETARRFNLPELPEVETVVRGLKKPLSGAVIKAVDLRREGLRYPFPNDLAGRVKGAEIKNIERRAKYILMALSNNETLIIHLGMSGRLTLLPQKPAAYQKHDHMIIQTDQGAEAILNDARRFGIVDLCPTPNIEQHKFFAHLGPEPLSNHFSPAYLEDKFRTRKTPVKVALLDQKLVVGVGNIYASEALFESQIDPRRPANSLNTAELNRLVPAIRRVLEAAIKAGGSSLRDYVQASGELGYFQHSWAVYNQKGQPCPGCTCDPAITGGIQKIAQGGRSTFYCPNKQN